MVSKAEVVVEQVIEAIRAPAPEAVEGLSSRHAIALLVRNPNGSGVVSVLAALNRRQVFAIPGAQAQVPAPDETGPFVKVYAQSEEGEALDWMKKAGRIMGGCRMVTITV